MQRVLQCTILLACALIGHPVAQSSPLAEYEFSIPGLITDLTVDNDDRVYIAGSTRNAAFPVTADAADSLCEMCQSGSDEGFLAILDPSGAIEYATFIGGQSVEFDLRLAVTPEGRIWIAGMTASREFLPKRNPDDCLMRYPTFFLVLLTPGKRAFDDFRCMTGVILRDIAADADGDVWITGSAEQQLFPVRNAYQPAAAGQADGILMEFSHHDRLHTYASFIGGSGNDFSEALAITRDGDIVLVGTTTSPDFPVVRAFQPQLRRGRTSLDGFIVRMNRSGRYLEYASYFGGGANDFVYGLALDANGRVFMTGSTQSSDFPVTTDAADTTCGIDGNCDEGRSGSNVTDVYVVAVTERGELLASTFLGGSGNDVGRRVTALRSGVVVVSGYTQSPDFPLIDARPTMWAPTLAGELPFASALGTGLTSLQRSTFIPMTRRPPAPQGADASERFIYTAASTTALADVTIRRITLR